MNFRGGKKNFRGEVAIASRPGLPPGVGQGDCDGGADEFGDAGSGELWRSCVAADQEAIAARFAVVQGDDVRDALLDAEDLASALAGGGGGRTDEARGMILGKQLWRAWIRHRDRALRDLHRRGRLRAS